MSLEQLCTSVENFCDIIVLIPVPVLPNIAGGALEVGMGITRIILSTGIGVVAVVPSLIARDISVINGCASHFVGGFENIVMGIFKAIPIVGPIIAAGQLAGRIGAPAGKTVVIQIEQQK